jgi:phosphoribosylanthranilate isomerase
MSLSLFSFLVSRFSFLFSSRQINRIVTETGIDIVQLHGDEAADAISEINAPCIKVLHVAPKDSPEAASSSSSSSSESLVSQVASFAGKAVAILLDTRVPGKAGGGTGSVFDWTIADKVGVPVVLAGGLTVENVAAAVSGSDAIVGVDVSSSLEQSPGVKDKALVEAFIANARL